MGIIGLTSAATYLTQKAEEDGGHPSSAALRYLAPQTDQATARRDLDCLGCPDLAGSSRPADLVERSI